MQSMISMKDCLAFCDLTEEEVLAIAEHEHMPEMIAIAYAQYLAHKNRGMETVFKMIVDDIRAAQSRSDASHVRELLHVLHHFIRSHPEAAPKVHPWSKSL
ncbi:MAG: hypothetical protein GY789_21615 [Hyphomicrobiales bacterium]|nr:hypothetical protein [Hyphomicrobiales bacterium]